LELLGVLGSLAGAAVEIRPPGAKWAHYVSWQDGSEVADVRFEGSSALMHRKRALEALVTRLPANVTSHFSARVVDVVNMPATPERGAHVQLKIATSRRDGLAEAAVLETFDADALIGADGIKSAIREKIIPGARVRWTGTYAYRHLVPMASAQEALGDIGSEVRIWIGPHRVSSP
jgi:salicylate hydroxylase